MIQESHTGPIAAYKLNEVLNMRRIVFIVALATLLTGSMAGYVSARTGSSSEGVTNKTCPLMGEATKAKYRVEYNGQYVYFCCKACVEAFNSDPEAAIAKMSAEDKAAIQKNDACPISNEKIEKFDVKSEYDGKLVYFCCPDCKAKFDKEHPGAK